MKKTLPLTIVIITHRNDIRFISSLRSSQIAENVIIIDNNSDNNWEKLKKDFDFQLISRENRILDFAQVRNEALKLVKTDWVLFLDSDENLGASSKIILLNRDKIENILQKDLFDGISIIRRDVFLGKELKFGEAGNTIIVRMFKVKNGKFKRNVHEVAQISGRLGASKIIVSHFPHFDISEFIRTITNYSQMASLNEVVSDETRVINIFKMIFFPPLKFIQNYCFKLGFLDGYRGLVYAIIMSFHSLFVRVFYFENNIKKINKEINNKPYA
ncbi:glycosyltransferase [Patescibacteria group bacterium]|nr:glycosyltransferase [Patescibacteria group bacterium]